MTDNANSDISNEEWKAIDGADAGYDPKHSEEVLTQARANIRDLRMRPVRLRLTDRDGQPLARRKVRLQQQDHEFCFGEQLWPLDAMVRDGEAETSRARAWKDRFCELFNAATNLCYWTEKPVHDASKSEEHQGELRIENFAATVDWCLANHLTAKGHPLFWSIPKAIPDWLMRYDEATFMKFVEVRVRNMVSRFKGKVKIWDVVNEATWEPAPKNLKTRVWPHIEPIGDIADFIEPILRWCREEDPAALLLINDYGMEIDQWPSISGSDGSHVTAASQRKRYVQLLQELDRRGTPVDALGLQSHSKWFRTHAEQWRVYDAFGTTGIPIHVTEFWASRDGLDTAKDMSEEAIDELQAEYIANYLTCAFGHPKIDAFFFWGFMGTAISWNERSGHTLKPVFDRVRQLIHGEWKTALVAETDNDGVLEFSGFCGNYTAIPDLGASIAAPGANFTVSSNAKNDISLALSVRSEK